MRCTDTRPPFAGLHGKGLDALLDLMQGFDSGPVGIPNVNWMRV